MKYILLVSGWLKNSISILQTTVYLKATSLKYKALMLLFIYICIRFITIKYFNNSGDLLIHLYEMPKYDVNDDVYEELRKVKIAMFREPTPKELKEHPMDYFYDVERGRWYQFYDKTKAEVAAFLVEIRDIIESGDYDIIIRSHKDKEDAFLVQIRETLGREGDYIYDWFEPDPFQDSEVTIENLKTGEVLDGQMQTTETQKLFFFDFEAWTTSTKRKTAFYIGFPLILLVLSSIDVILGFDDPFEWEESEWEETDEEDEAPAS